MRALNSRRVITRIQKSEDQRRTAEETASEQATTKGSPHCTAPHLDEVKAQLSAHAPIFFIDDALCPSVCVLANQRSTLVEALVALCRSQDLVFSYAQQNSWKTDVSASEIGRVLMMASCLHFRLGAKNAAESLDLEFQVWKEFPAYVEGPKGNPISKKVWRRALDSKGIPSLGRIADLAEILKAPPQQRVLFDVDFVYTWVNSKDSNWQTQYDQHRPASATDASSLSRFVSRNELLYSLRALERYAPWVRRVYIVSNCEPPTWLNVEHPKVKWVRHEDIFEQEMLPTFNSHAIEARLHRIHGLSRHFVYSNDDFFLLRQVTKEDFFEANGLCRLQWEAWGNVNGSPHSADPDYLNAARNGQRLIEQEFGVSPTELPSHAPQALRVDVLEEMARRYPAQFESTSKSRFRSLTDISVTGFLASHYAYATGKASNHPLKTLSVQQTHDFQKLFTSLLAEKSQATPRGHHFSLCINDGADSHLNEAWNDAVSTFLDAYFERPSQFESD